MHAAVAKALRDQDIEVVFGLMGDANMLIVASFIDDGDGRFVSVVHEAGAVSMADGYHRMSGRPGVVSITHGPAFTNALTPLAEAVRFGSALLVMTGAPPTMRGHLQDIDIQALATSVGAGYERAWKPDSVAQDLALALRRAVVERRPIVFDVPSDMLLDDMDYHRAPVIGTPEIGVPSEASVDEALGIILSADRPVVLAGRGATRADARDKILEFARAIGAPVATTLLAKDLFAAEPENVGICGSLSSPPAVDAIAKSDCVIAFGASLSRHTADEGDLFAGKAIIQCSGPDSPTHQYTVPTVQVVGDCALTAEEFTRKTREVGATARTGTVKQVIEGVGAWKRQRDGWPDRSGAGTADLSRVLRRLSDVLTRERVVVTDAGRYTLTAWNEFESTTPGGFTHCASFGSIGLGLATAVGASIARPSELTVCLVGDGGFMMSAVHLWTAAHERANLVVIVANDGSYGAEYDKLNSYGVAPEHSLMEWPSLAQLAQGYGMNARTISSESDLDDLVRDLDEWQYPLLLDVRIDPKLTANYDGSPK